MNTLHLIIPQLILSPQSIINKRHQALKRLIKWASKTNVSTYSAEASLYSLAGINNSSNQLPAASILPVELINTKKSVLMACPLFCQTGMSDVVASTYPVNDLSKEEAQSLLLALNTFFIPVGVQFQLHITQHSTQWSIQVPTAYIPEQLAVPSTILGCNLFTEIQKHRHYHHWNQLLSEIQMFLHNTSFNLNRQLKGQVALNYFWLWGASQQHQATPPQHNINQIIAINHANTLLTPFADQVANFLGCPLTLWDNKTNPIQTLLSNNNNQKQVLILDQLLHHHLNHDQIGYQQCLGAYESNYFNYLLKWIEEDPNNQLTIDNGNGKQLTLTKPSLFKRLFSL